MATLIDLIEATVDPVSRAKLSIDLAEYLRLDQADDIALAHTLAETAWQRVEARIPHRFAPRAFTAIIQAHKVDEQVVLPLKPVAVTAVELFDPEVGGYAAESPLIAGPEESSYVLPKRAFWRLSGTAGPTPAIPAPAAIDSALVRLVAFAFENRGDVGHDFDMEGAMIGSGAADFLRPFVRV